MLLRSAAELSINIGALGKTVIPSGILAYVGSAMGKGSTSLESRIRRHFSLSKRIHWHIDYLLNGNLDLYDAIFAESAITLECSLVAALVNHQGYDYGPKGFGASDCKQGCTSHLLLVTRTNPIDMIEEIMRGMNLRPRRWSET